MEILYKKYRVNLKYTFGISRERNDWYDRILLFIKHKNIYGVGEAAPSIRYGETVELIEDVLKTNILIPDMLNDYESIWDYLLPKLKGLKSLEAAISMALLDYFGKLNKIPLCNLLNIKDTKSNFTSYTISIGKISQIKNKIQDAKPFKILKVKLGTKGQDKNIIREIRKYTDKKIRVDANEGWTFEEGLDLCRWLEDYNIELIEQPFAAHEVENTKLLKNESSIDIIADENSCNKFDILKIHTAFDGVNIKLMKCGSLFEAIDMIKIAKDYNMKIMLGCMIETSAAISAMYQISGEADFLDLDGNLLIENDPFKGVIVENGVLKGSLNPGIGAVLKNKYKELLK